MMVVNSIDAYCVLEILKDAAEMPVDCVYITLSI